MSLILNKLKQLSHARRHKIQALLKTDLSQAEILRQIEVPYAESLIVVFQKEKKEPDLIRYFMCKDTSIRKFSKFG